MQCDREQNQQSRGHFCLGCWYKVTSPKQRRVWCAGGQLGAPSCANPNQQQWPLDQKVGKSTGKQLRMTHFGASKSSIWHAINVQPVFLLWHSWLTILSAFFVRFGTHTLQSMLYNTVLKFKNEIYWAVVRATTMHQISQGLQFKKSD